VGLLRVKPGLELGQLVLGQPAGAILSGQNTGNLGIPEPVCQLEEDVKKYVWHT
jgi:hypothetical protein